MLSVWNNQPLHTQNTTGKHSKLRKQTFPKPQVWCAIFRAPHPHKEKKRNNGLQRIKASMALNKRLKITGGPPLLLKQVFNVF
jgi:hypothetical protein